MTVKPTTTAYDEAVSRCRNIFQQKVKDYGPSWRVLRPSSLTDQIFIKANRIRTLQEKQTQKVPEGIDTEFMGIYNYGLIGLIQLDRGEASTAPEAEASISETELRSAYDHWADKARELMLKKNHDYGEAWRDMRLSSLTDMILVRVMRIRKIEENRGKTVASEGIAANYLDTVNYAIFALLKLKETTR